MRVSQVSYGVGPLDKGLGCRRLATEHKKQTVKHFIIFERNAGHCVTILVQALSLRDALTKYAVTQLGYKLQSDGTLTRDTIVYHHPLTLIEAECKSNNRYDELQVDSRDDRLLNQACWEIRALSQKAWEAETAEIFCSAEPWSLSCYVALCRPALRKKVPRSRSRAFVWYLEDGPLVTFYRGKINNGPLDIVGRYFIPWQRQYWPNPYTLTPEMVEEWQGTDDDLLSQMRIEYPD